MNTRIRPQSQSPGAASAEAHGPEQIGVSSPLTPGSPLHAIWQPTLTGRPRGSVWRPTPPYGRKAEKPKAHAAVGAAVAEARWVIVSGSRRMYLKGVWGGDRRPKTLLCPRTRLCFGEPESQGVWEEGEATHCWLCGLHVDLSGPPSILKINCLHLQLAPPGTSSYTSHLACSPCFTPLAWPEQARRLVTLSSQAAPQPARRTATGQNELPRLPFSEMGEPFPAPTRSMRLFFLPKGLRIPCHGGRTQLRQCP